MFEVRAQQVGEFIAVEFFDMVGVIDARYVCVFMFIRARNNQQAAGFENAANLEHHLLMLVVVLDRLETHNDIDAVFL